MTRHCGDCTLCCKLVPVHDGVLINGKRMPGSIDKKSGERCKYQRFGKGCMVYNTSKMPSCCQLWNCRWLVNDDTHDLPRPDRVHYVIDVLPDYVTVVDHTTGAKTNVEVIQIWCDPHYPDAHRDPALRRYLERQGEQNKMALIRYNEKDAMTLIPPAMTGKGFVEYRQGTIADRGEYNAANVAQALGGKMKVTLAPSPEN
jgi:hypothetical protein